MTLSPSNPDSSIVVYSDFNCPFCYALNERLVQLGVAEQLEWRGVQHAPHLSVPLAPAEPLLRLELLREVAAIGHLASELPIQIPPGKPNTGEAIRWAAAALRVDVYKGHVFKDELYRAFWQRGADLSDPVVLRGLADAAGLPSLSPGDADAERATAWERSWRAAGVSAVPALVAPDGDGLMGLQPLPRLIAFLNRPRRGGAGAA